MPKLIYLGSPYSHPDEKVREQRFRAVARAAGWIYTRGEVFVYTPISMTHQIGIELSAFPTLFEWNSWAGFDEFMIAKCDEFWILVINGWDTSVGLSAEIKIATRLGMPIRYVIPEADSYRITDKLPLESVLDDKTDDSPTNKAPFEAI
jgi:hypothetical protein